MGTRLLRYYELVAHGVPYSRGHIYRLEKAGQFPRRVPIGENTIGWVEREIDAYVADKIESRVTDIGAVGSDKAKGRAADATRPETE